MVGYNPLTTVSHLVEIQNVKTTGLINIFSNIIIIEYIILIKFI